MRAFQIMRAEKTIIARLSNWNRSWRLFAQSFFSSRTCLSNMSLIMFVMVDSIYFLVAKRLGIGCWLVNDSWEIRLWCWEETSSDELSSSHNGELMCMHWVTDRHPVISVPVDNAVTSLFSTWRFLRFPSNFETWLIHNEKLISEHNSRTTYRIWRWRVGIHNQTGRII